MKKQKLLPFLIQVSGMMLDTKAAISYPVSYYYVVYGVDSKAGKASAVAQGVEKACNQHGSLRKPVGKIVRPASKADLKVDYGFLCGQVAVKQDAVSARKRAS